MSDETSVARTEWRDAAATVMRDLWSRHGRTLLIIAAAYMVVAAVGRLVYAVPYLVSDPEGWAAIDLKMRYGEVERWFAGLPFYGAIQYADYPPASYAMLWPLLGWLELTPARWLFAATMAVILAVFAYLITRESGAGTRPQRLFVGLLAFSAYPIQMTIFAGQLGLHVVVLVLAGLVWLHRSRGRWWEDVPASLCLVLALVKPTLSVPFFWIVLFVPRRVRPVAMIVIGYGVFTVIAAAFQEPGLPGLLLEWLSHADSQIPAAASFTNIHKWLSLAGLKAMMLPASLFMLTALGVWTYVRRKADFWILLGIAAIVARLWFYHRPYDDVLIILPMISLFRITKEGPLRDGTDVTAGLLLAATWATMHIPTWAFYNLSQPFLIALEIVQGVVWLSVLAFLLVESLKSRAYA